MSRGSRAGSDVAVIRGGASGFGLALGKGCAARSMTVVLLDRDGPGAEAEAAALPGAYDVDALLAGEPYVVTHGDLVEAVASRCEDLGRAPELAR
jgi:NAD(P)-dependent dehydrogenase (short-subunit alcohol dehydrogenase family)